MQDYSRKRRGRLTNDEIAHHQHHALEPMGLAVLHQGQYKILRVFKFE